MARRSKAERRRRARKFFKVLLGILTVGVLPLWQGRMARKYGTKGEIIGDVVEGVANGAGEALDD